MPKYCNICRGSKRITLPCYADPETDMVIDPLDDDIAPAQSIKQFDCPQCVPSVPYRRVRATKIVTAYEAEYFGKYQMPIERTLAARFGEYLLREGLIKFSQSGSKDMGPMDSKIVVTAHLGVVSREDTIRAGAIPEIGATPAPPLPRKLTDRERKRLRVTMDGEAYAWNPPALPGVPAEPLTDEFDEPKDALGARFAGLEIE